MTVMQFMYAKVRVEQKLGHRAALRFMSKETGIDPDSIDRALQRARRADAIDAKRSKKAAQPKAGDKLRRDTKLADDTMLTESA